MLINILIPALISFAIGIAITPITTHFLYKYKVWKKVGGKKAIGGKEAKEFNRIKGDGETKTPRMGGVVIWASVLITIVGVYVLSFLFPESFFSQFDYLSRSQTLIPVTMLFFGAAVGFLNDVYDVTRDGRGLSLFQRLGLITCISGFLGWWFYTKLGVSEVNIPFNGSLELGVLIVPFCGQLPL